MKILKALFHHVVTTLPAEGSEVASISAVYLHTYEVEVKLSSTIVGVSL